jgi:curved DNA-binding protein CbpA
VTAGAEGVSFDPYAVLGVSSTASTDDIRHAYRVLARRFHPDADGHDARAAALFARATEAYDLLVDDDRRRTYDLRRAASAGPRAARVAPGPTGNTAVRGPAAEWPRRPTGPRRPPAAEAQSVRSEQDEFRLMLFLAKVVVVVVIVIVAAALLLAFRPPPRCGPDTPANAPCTPVAIAR